MTTRGPFQPQPLCDFVDLSVVFRLCCSSSGRNIQERRSSAEPQSHRTNLRASSNPPLRCADPNFAVRVPVCGSQSTIWHRLLTPCTGAPLRHLFGSSCHSPQKYNEGLNQSPNTTGQSLELFPGEAAHLLVLPLSPVPSWRHQAKLCPALTKTLLTTRNFIPSPPSSPLPSPSPPSLPCPPCA